MLNLTDVSVRRGTRVLFEGATFALFSGEKVGITGANGSGKSSLLALVRGELHADSGTVDIAADLQIAYVGRSCCRVRVRRSSLYSTAMSGCVRSKRALHWHRTLGCILRKAK